MLIPHWNETAAVEIENSTDKFNVGAPTPAFLFDLGMPHSSWDVELQKPSRFGHSHSLMALGQ